MHAVEQTSHIQTVSMTPLTRLAIIAVSKFTTAWALHP
jgi:hypothetical protein